MSLRFPFKETAWIYFQEQKSLPEINTENPHFFRLGDTVALKENPSHTIGEITTLNNSSVVVSIPDYMKRAFMYSIREVENEFNAEELVKTEGFSLEQIADAIYSRTYHSFCNPGRNYFDGWQTGSILCQSEGCNTKAIGVGVINYWGTVFPIAVCEEHTHFHGCLTDDYCFTPLRKI